MIKEMILIFNGKSEVFLGQMEVSPNIELQLNTKHCKYKRATFDPTIEFYSGTFSEGKIESLSTLKTENNVAIVKEIDLKFKCRKKIEKQFPSYVQLNIMRETLDTILNALPKTTQSKIQDEDSIKAFNKMCKYIEHTVDNHKRYIDMYEKSANHVLVTKDMEWSTISDELDAGMRSIIGREPLDMLERHRI